MTGLTRQQHDVLLLPIKKHRVGQKDGLSHVEAYDIRAHLDRVFGFGGWSGDVTDVTMLYEQSKEEKGDTRWRAAYRATYRLEIHATGATYTESAVGTNFGWLPNSKRDETHDMAIKTAASQALKRCAINLGDQFGLSLYNKGSLVPLVGTSLVVPAATTPDAAPDVDGHITTQLAPEDSPAQEADTAVETSTRPATDTPPGQATTDPGVVADLREKALTATKKADLARLLTDAAKAGVTGALTSDGSGKGMTLETLILARIKAA